MGAPPAPGENVRSAFGEAKTRGYALTAAFLADAVECTKAQMLPTLEAERFRRCCPR